MYSIILKAEFFNTHTIFTRLYCYRQLYNHCLQVNCTVVLLLYIVWFEEELYSCVRKDEFFNPHTIFTRLSCYRQLYNHCLQVNCTVIVNYLV
jgi:hypothetical protein